MDNDRLPKVLIVEDEEYLLSLYENWLADSYDVLATGSGDEALSNIDEEVDVVLLDRKLPDVSGDDILDRIRNRDLDTRVAMITSVDVDFDIIDMDFDTYVQKPVDEDDLREVVEQLLTRTMFDDRVRRFLQVATKRSELEANIPREELERHDDYAQLVDEQRDLRAELEYIIQSLDDDYFMRSILDLTSEEFEEEFGHTS